MNKALVVRIASLAPHPQSEELDIAQLEAGDRRWQVVVGKHYAVDERGVFFPDGAVVPADLLEEMWLRGKLHGPGRNRVKAKQLRGIHSEGIFYGSSYGKRWNLEWPEGQDVTEELGVVFAEESDLSPEDRAFIGEKRRCVECNLSTPMWWVPSEAWRRYVPEKHRRGHVCIDCFMIFATVARATGALPAGGWIGCDLDGTLAHYDEWRGIEHIGEPIAPMVDRVKAWIEQGINVRIVTARTHNGAKAVEIVEDWCERHLGVRLPVTSEKDFGMIRLYDDRAVQVQTNTGVLLIDAEEWIKEGL